MLGLIIYIVIIVMLLYMVAKTPVWGVSAVIFLFSIDLWGVIHSRYLMTNSYIMNVVIGLMVLIAFVKSKTLGTIVKLSNDTSWIQILTIGLVCYALLSTLWSPKGDLAIEKWTTQIPYYIIAIFVVPQLFNKLEDSAALIKSILLLGGLFLFLFTFMVTWRGRSILSEVGGQPIALPLAVATSAGIVFLTSVLATSLKGKLWLIVRISLAILSILLVFKTSSRGQLLGMFATAFLLFPFSRRVKNIGAFIVMAIVFLAIAYLAQVFYEMTQIEDTRWTVDEMNQDLEGRFYASLSLLDHWVDGGAFSWLFGLGNSASFEPSIVGFYPHCVPVEILGEEGMIGFGMFLAINFLTVNRVWQSFRYTKYNFHDRNPLVLLSSYYLYALLLSMKSGALFGSSTMLLFPILVERCLKLLKPKCFEVMTEAESQTRSDNSKTELF